MSTSGHTVFVYGTLKPGGHYWPQFCEGKVSSIVPAKIRGELYDLHLGYPGLKLRGHDWVQGMLLHFPSDADFARVDELEDFDPRRPMDENEYIRLNVPCFDPDGEPLGDYWTYEITDSVLESTSCTRISNGNWPV